MTAFAALVTSSLILITSMVGYVYDLIAKDYKHQKNGFEKIDNSEDSEAHYRLGIIYTKKLLIDKAIGEFKESLMLRPDYQEAEEELQKALHLKGK